MERRLIVTWLVVLLTVAGAAHAEEGYTFDASEYAKKDLEIKGYLEGKGEAFNFDRQSAFYRLDHPAGNRPTDSLRGTATGEVTAKYTKDIFSFDMTFHADGQRDTVNGNSSETKFYEANLTLQPQTGLSLDIGKKVLKWGKGYAWNPVGFVERPKDPTDPDLSREGYWMVVGDYTRSFDGPVQTAGLTTVLIPTTPFVNNDFGPQTGYQDVAGKFSLLVEDTDVDLMILSGGAKSLRYGADFARNLNARLEVHGEVAHVAKSQRMLLDSSQKPYADFGEATSWLLGLRYLTDEATTYILEYYHNGTGYKASEQEAFFRLADQAVDAFQSSGSRTLLSRANTMRLGYAAQNSGRDYVNFKVSQDEPLGIVYLTPSLTVIADVGGHSAMILPELLYTGITNWEFRLRFQANVGEKRTEYGEKEAAMKTELRVRRFF